MIRRISGKAKQEWSAKKASTAINLNGLLTYDGSGYLTPATSASTRIAGVSLKKVASTDSDYAATTKIPVDFLSPEDIVEADVTGTLTQANVGNAYDLTDDSTVNLSGTTHKVVTCVGVVSSSRGLFKVNAMAAVTPGA